jgi:acetolactate synthase-1/2/3 large subunit
MLSGTQVEEFMAKSKRLSVGRRNFLKSAAGAAAVVAGTLGAEAQQAQAPAPRPSGTPLLAKEVDPPASVEVLTSERPGSDFMVDVIKSLGFEYICANPGSSFRALHESVINYGGNTSPEFITCCHEESAIGMAHGYVKIEGKPM